jgi:chromosome partitioning protein
MGTILTIATSKGGGGKTALTTCLGANLAALGYRIAVIDADRNQSFASWHAANYEGPPFACFPEIRAVEVVDEANTRAETHDVVLIDTAGFENQTTAFAMSVADMVLIPCMPDRHSMLEAVKTGRQVGGLARASRREISCRVVRTRWNVRGLAEQATIEDLVAAGLTVTRGYLPDLSEFSKLTYSGVVPLTGRIGIEIDKLVSELAELAAIPPKPIAAYEVSMLSREVKDGV